MICWGLLSFLVVIVVIDVTVVTVTTVVAAFVGVVTASLDNCSVL